MSHYQQHHRHSTRLPNYDYTSCGKYFVTICTYEKSSTFGIVEHGRVVLNDYGLIAETELYNTESLRNNVELDCFIVMPNHIHAILIITVELQRTDAEPIQTTGRMQCAPTKTDDRGIGSKITPVLDSADKEQELMSISHSHIQQGSLGMIIRGYKSAVTGKINAAKNTPQLAVWQRNYYDHIIRSQDELRLIREYIKNNPANWKNDNYYVI